MNNDNNERANDHNEILDEKRPQFMSAICQLRSTELSGTVRQQPLKGIKRSCNQSMVGENFKDRTIWTSGYFPSSLVEFRRSRTSFEVLDTNIMTVANRIFESNRNRSIHAVYDGAIMRCKTISHVIFTIRLVRSSQKSDVVLVDVRRETGCPMMFRNEFQALHSVVYGEIIPCEFPRSVKSQGEIQFKLMDTIPLDESDIELSLEVASADIESKMHDACVVTLQDLSITTDPSKETSPIACKMILDKYCNIFEYIIDDIRKRVDYGCGYRHYCDSEENMRCLTLGLLGNILTVVPKHRALDSLMQNMEQITSIIKSLQWFIQMAEKCPQNASLAIKCLRLFVQTDTIVTFDSDTNVSLENAIRYGRLSYPNLEKEAQAALIAIRV